MLCLFVSWSIWSFAACCHSPGIFIVICPFWWFHYQSTNKVGKKTPNVIKLAAFSKSILCLLNLAYTTDKLNLGAIYHCVPSCVSIEIRLSQGVMWKWLCTQHGNLFTIVYYLISTFATKGSGQCRSMPTDMSRTLTSHSAACKRGHWWYVRVNEINQ